MIKVVVADIDGTLCDISHVLTEETRKALNGLLASGIKVGLATGRQVTNVDYYWQNWNLDRAFDFYIGMNGAMLFDNETKQLCTSHLMDFDQAMKIVEYMAPLGLKCNFYCDDDTHYLMGVDEQTEDARRRNPGLHIVELSQDFHEMKGRKIFRILFRVKMGNMDIVQQYVKEHPIPQGFKGFQTQPICYEIMLDGVSKANGLEMYCNNRNISMDEVYAFGDTSNDVEMLKCCHGVCLCDGTQDAKDAAEYITEYPCTQSGFARFVQEKIL